MRCCAQSGLSPLAEWCVSHFRQIYIRVSVQPQHKILKSDLDMTHPHARRAASDSPLPSEPFRAAKHRSPSLILKPQLNLIVAWLGAPPVPVACQWGTVPEPGVKGRRLPALIGSSTVLRSNAHQLEVISILPAGCPGQPGWVAQCHRESAEDQGTCTCTASDLGWSRTSCHGHS